MRNSANTKASVFTYGTLAITEVMEAVTGKTFPSYEGIADHFSSFLLKDRIYPGMTSAPNHTTKGRLYVEVDMRTLWLLDQFEDPVYCREMISVMIPSLETTIPAYAYVIPLQHQDHLSSQPWNRQDFVDLHSPAYLASCQLFHQRMRGQAPT